MAYLARAAEAVDACSTYAQTLRPGRLMKMVRLLVEVDGLAITTLLPMVGNALLSPSIDPQWTRDWTQAWASTLNGQRPAVARTDFELGYYRIRLRVGRLKHNFMRLAQLGSPERVGTAAQEIMEQCLINITPPMAPIDLVDDYLTVACQCIRIGNLALARLALTKANDALRCQGNAIDGAGQHPRLCGMIDQIASLTTTLTSMAS